MTSVIANAPTTGKLPGLDGLRALAVLAVFAFHFGALPFGWVGVQAFFVLSGFLITQLLRQNTSTPLGHYLWTFYGRRALRIFPLFFVVLAAFYLACQVGMEAHGLREGLPYAATYIYNWYHATSAFVHSKLITHSWSLCVEEQFYLLWPFVVYFCSTARLRTVLICVMLLGPLVRGAEWWAFTHFPNAFLDAPELALYVVTPTHMDAFATGAFVAVFYRGGGRLPLAATALALLVAGVAIVQLSAVPAAAWASLGFPIGMLPAYGFIWAYSLLNIGSAFLIRCLVRREFFPSFFDNPVLRYIGKVSYGFYILHFPVQSLVAKAAPHLASWLQLSLQLVITMALASLSFHLFESPVLALKDRWFPTHRLDTTSTPELPMHGLEEAEVSGLH
jgi:peptidoglycan/LPS O-acetylase OafA/YrhL